MTWFSVSVSFFTTFSINFLQCSNVPDKMFRKTLQCLQNSALRLNRWQLTSDACIEVNLSIAMDHCQKKQASPRRARNTTCPHWNEIWKCWYARMAHGIIQLQIAYQVLFDFEDFLFRHIPLKVVTYVSMSLTDCGEIAEGAGNILGGTNAVSGNSPWHVGIYYFNKNNVFNQICGGTIISRNFVISGMLFWINHYSIARWLNGFRLKMPTHVHIYVLWWVWRKICASVKILFNICVATTYIDHLLTNISIYRACDLYT